MVFATYAILRLFTNKKELLIDGDEARHLKTAKTFYKMWNNSFYDFHPPLYSLLIKVFDCVFEDYKAGILVSFLSSCGLLLVSANLLHELGLNEYQLYVALYFMCFNYTLIYFSNRIFRYSTFALLFTSAFLALITHHWVWCGVLWGLTLLTCSFNGLRFFWVWLLAGQFNPIPIIVAMLIYLPCWIFPKFDTYLRNKYYPSGPEGKLDMVHPFTLKQLLSPMYFPFNYAYYGSNIMKKDFKGWAGRIMGVWGLYPTNKWIYPLWIVLFLFTLLGIFQGPLWLVITTILLLSPSLDLKYRPRNSIMVIPIIGYFLARGITALWNFRF